jgi:hypothetical protein
VRENQCKLQSQVTITHKLDYIAIYLTGEVYGWCSSVRVNAREYLRCSGESTIGLHKTSVMCSHPLIAVRQCLSLQYSPHRTHTAAVMVSTARGMYACVVCMIPGLVGSLVTDCIGGTVMDN